MPRKKIAIKHAGVLKAGREAFSDAGQRKSKAPPTFGKPDCRGSPAPCTPDVPLLQEGPTLLFCSMRLLPGSLSQTAHLLIIVQIKLEKAHISPIWLKDELATLSMNPTQFED